MVEGKGRVRLKDIADVCGCSVNTVSCALRNNPRISKETRELIQQTASEMGYVRNNLASSLRSGKTNMVSIIVNEVKNPHFAGMINNIEKYLNAAGYELIVLLSPGQKTNMQMIRLAISMAVDGILYYPFSFDKPVVEYIERSKIPFILLDRWIPGVNADTVRCDDKEGGYLAGSRFLSLNHKSFLYVAGPLSNSSQIDRQEGFFNAIAEAGLPFSCVRIISWEKMQQALVSGDLVEQLSPFDYTAVFSFSDEMAYFIMKAFANNGIRIPEDISILGFDHIRQYFPYLSPLSSISVAEEYDFAKLVVQLLLRKIMYPNENHYPVVLPVNIFDEGTIGPAQRLL